MTYINIHTHTPAPNALVQGELGNPSRPAPPYCLGIHPWAAGCVDAALLLARLRDDVAVTAVGEIGLDFACDAPRDVQAQLFEYQLAIAASRRLPVVVHCVRAFEPVLETLRKFELPAVILHGYVGNSQQTAAAVAAGHYLSMSGHSIRSSRTREALLTVPLERLFVETDDEPVSIEEMYAAVAVLRDVSVATLAEATARNFGRIFS